MYYKIFPHDDLTVMVETGHVPPQPDDAAPDMISVCTRSVAELAMGDLSLCVFHVDANEAMLDGGEVVVIGDLTYLHVDMKLRYLTRAWKK